MMESQVAQPLVVAVRSALVKLECTERAAVQQAALVWLAIAMRRVVAAATPE